MAATDSVPVQRIGPYTQGEHPRPLDITITDENDVVINLTDFTAQEVVIEAVDQVVAGLGAGTTSILTPAGGVTRYVWDKADFTTAGLYRLQMWVEKGNQRYASDVFEYFVEDLTTQPF